MTTRAPPSRLGRQECDPNDASRAAASLASRPACRRAERVVSIVARRAISLPGSARARRSAVAAILAPGSALVPRQISTGDRTILGGISRRGNTYLRSLFVQGPRAVLLRPESWPRYGFGRWLTAAVGRLHRNALAVALANKLARIAWGVLHGRSHYSAAVQARAA
jgi:transposase